MTRLTIRNLVVTMASPAALLTGLNLLVVICTGCSTSSDDVRLARADIAVLKYAVENSDESDLPHLMSDSALRYYDNSGHVDWNRLVVDVAGADQTIQSVIRVTPEIDATTLVGWNSAYHILLRAARFRRTADGKLVFDGLLNQQVFATDRETAPKYLMRLSEERLKRGYLSPAHLQQDSQSVVTSQPDASSMPILPDGVSPGWICHEEVAYLKLAADTLEGIDQLFTAAAGRWTLEDIAQKGTELALAGRAMDRIQPDSERLKELRIRHRNEITSAWESLKSQYHQIEQDQPQFVRELGDTIDKFMSVAAGIQESAIE